MQKEDKNRYNQTTMIKKGWWYVTLILFIAGITVGFFLSQAIRTPNQSAQNIPTTKQCPYKFINPLRCEPDLVRNKKEYVALRNKLLSYIADEKKHDTITEAAIYFRDLENGPAININDQIAFAQASLLKLPLMISYYKKAQDAPGI